MADGSPAGDKGTRDTFTQTVLPRLSRAIHQREGDLIKSAEVPTATSVDQGGREANTLLDFPPRQTINETIGTEERHRCGIGRELYLDVAHVNV